jgi:hypothetical protein
MRADQYLPPDRPILDKRLSALDKPGQHLWIMIGTWHIADPAAAYDPARIKLMDRENLLSFQGPGCFKCERPYSAKMAKRPCLGSVEADGGPQS